jgi:hypothetical protein
MLQPVQIIQNITWPESTHAKGAAINQQEGRESEKGLCVARTRRVTLLPGEAAVFVFSRLSSVIS